MHTVGMPGAQGHQKRTLDSLELVLQRVASHQSRCWEDNTDSLPEAAASNSWFYCKLRQHNHRTSPAPMLEIEPCASCTLGKGFAAKLNPPQLCVELLLGDRISPAGHF